MPGSAWKRAFSLKAGTSQVRTRLSDPAVTITLPSAEKAPRVTWWESLFRYATLSPVSRSQTWAYWVGLPETATTNLPSRERPRMRPTCGTSRLALTLAVGTSQVVTKAVPRLSPEMDVQI